MDARAGVCVKVAQLYWMKDGAAICAMLAISPAARHSVVGVRPISDYGPSQQMRPFPPGMIAATAQMAATCTHMHDTYQAGRRTRRAGSQRTTPQTRFLGRGDNAISSLQSIAPATGMTTYAMYTVRGWGSSGGHIVMWATKIQWFLARHPKAPFLSGASAATKCAPLQTIVSHGHDVVASRDETAMTSHTLTLDCLPGNKANLVASSDGSAAVCTTVGHIL